MGFMGICIDFFAWPLIALGYPMFASIRAIESGSKHHMRKLVTYWTIFSLISLFEFAFVKVIDWIPCWSSIKLVAVLWLVMPGFDGACDAYESLIRPLLRVDLQALIDRFHYCNQKEQKLRKSEDFVDIAEEYIKENGLESLEKLISSKHDCKEPGNSRRSTQVLEPEAKDAAATAGGVHFELVQNADSSFSWVPKGNNAACEVKETTPIKPPEIPPPQKVEQEWNCNLCKVKTTSKKTLNAHLQGSKHKSNCEALKASKLFETGKSNQGNTEAGKSKVGQGSQQKSAGKKLPNKQQKKDGASTQEFKLWCNMCNVKLLSEIDFASHVEGKRHLANVNEMVKLGDVVSRTCKEMAWV